jgi:HSP20 family protein
MSKKMISQKNDNELATRSEGNTWEPFNMLRSMLRWDPNLDIMPLWRSDEQPVFIPSFEIMETKDVFLFKADMPGVKEQDLDISVAGNLLSVRGKREAELDESDDTYFACERSYGSFARSFTLPNSADPDHVRAEIAHGVLTLAIRKKPELQPKHIAVKSADTAQV